MTMDRIGLGEMGQLKRLGDNRFTLIPNIGAKSMGLRATGQLGNLVNEYNVPVKRLPAPLPPRNRSVPTLQWPPKRGAETPDISDTRRVAIRGTLMRDGAILGMNELQGPAGVVADPSAILKGVGAGYGINNFVSATSKGVTYSGNTAQLRHDGDKLVLVNPAESKVNAVFTSIMKKNTATTSGGVTLKPGESKTYYITGEANPWGRANNIDIDVTLVDTPPSTTESTRLAEEARLQKAIQETNNRTDLDPTTKAQLVNDLQGKLGATTAYGVSGALTPMLPWLVVGGVGIAIVAALFAGRKK